MQENFDLFSPSNPLLERLGPRFFRELPQQPGIYFMKGASGEILYVGKAKSLKARLASYKLARPNTASRKVLRLLRLTRSIDIELCGSEKEALLLENKYLRALTPPFNVVNTSPQSYYFICLKTRESERDSKGRLVAQLRLTNDLGGVKDPGRVYGAFKSRRLARVSYQALLRLLCAVEVSSDGFYFPQSLVRYRAPAFYALPVGADLLGPLQRFLSGNSAVFLERLTDRLLGNTLIPRYIHHVIGEDLKQLNEFYRYGSRRLKRLRKACGIRRRAIAQDEIDDLLVVASFGGGPARR